MISFPRGTEMFQFPRCPPRTLCIQVRVTKVHLVGFPHSEMSGSTLATSSPDLFAGDRVLLRPLAPRHPPRALCSLTYFQHPAGPSAWRMRDRVRFAIGETRLTAAVRTTRGDRYLSSSSVVKVHHHSLGSGHDTGGQARTDGDRIRAPSRSATTDRIAVGRWRRGDSNS